MKTLQMIVLFVAATCAVVGCDDRTGEGSCIFCTDTFNDNDSIAYGDGVIDNDVVEPDKSPPDSSTDSEDDDVLTTAEYCTPYIGTWDCECTGGVCTLGQHVYYVITLLQPNDGVWTLWLEVIDGGSYSFTCDPKYPPPTDGYGTTIEVTSANTMEEVFHNPNHPNLDWLTTSCTRLE